MIKRHSSSFIESPFCTKVEYERYILLPDDEQTAAWATSEGRRAVATIGNSAYAMTARLPLSVDEFLQLVPPNLLSIVRIVHSRRLASGPRTCHLGVSTIPRGPDGPWTMLSAATDVSDRAASR